MHIAKLLDLKPEMNFLDQIGDIKKFTSLNNLFYARFCWLGNTNIHHTGIGNRISSSLCCKTFALLAWVLQEICSNSEFPVSSVRGDNFNEPWETGFPGAIQEYIT